MQPPKTAKYLLRFDDLCPTMNWKVWSEIEAALTDHRLKPILAVVPDNRDPKLRVAAPAQDFWERVRRWQARGWTIALHGFQHKYIAERPGIITPRKQTEFAGVPTAEQEEKLRRGMEIFKEQGVYPRVWIAPSNSFDGTTVSLLPGVGIRIICDGCFRLPFVSQRQHVVWVPQQLYCFRPAPRGIWTVCYHHNQWTASDLVEFRKSLDRYHADIWSLDEVLQAWGGRRSQWSAWLCTNPRLSQLLIRVELKFWEWWSSNGGHSGPIQTSCWPAEPGSAQN
jgi:predicted deacetylase